MSLFDELLTKNQTGGGSAQQDPLVSSGIIITDSSPVITSDPGVLITNSEPPVIMTDDPIKKISVDASPVIAAEDAPAPFVPLEDTTVIAEPPKNSSLFNMINSDDPTPAEEIKEVKKVFQGTDEYIDHAIEEVSLLIGNLEEFAEKKLLEESEYKEQEEHYAALKLQSDVEHQKILAELAHAEEMRSYMERERAKKSEPQLESVSEVISDEPSIQIHEVEEEDSLVSEIESTSDEAPELVIIDDEVTPEPVEPKKSLFF